MRIIYIRFSQGEIRVSNWYSGETVIEEPLLAILQSSLYKKKIVAYGRKAREIQNDNVTVINGFDHERSCVNDGLVVRELFKRVIAHVFRVSLLQKIGLSRNKYTAVIHPIDHVGGDLTLVEKYFLASIVNIASGISSSYTWVGRDLTMEDFSPEKFNDIKLNLSGPFINGYYDYT